VVFDEESILLEKSIEDKVQGGASDSSADFLSKEFEFSDNPQAGQVR